MFNQIIFNASQNGLKQFAVLDRVAQNVGNLNTPGYKTRRFDTYLTLDNRLQGIERVDTSQGPVMTTERPLDIAIDGDGYLPVTRYDGQVFYTRAGSLARNAEGYLTTAFGDLVAGGIQLPDGYKQLMISPEGTVSVRMPDVQDPVTVGKIELVTFPNAEGLENVGQNKLAATEASGEPQPVLGDSRIVQGALERSNVNTFHQVDQILRLNAGVISNFRLIKFTDDLFRQGINLKQ